MQDITDAIDEFVQGIKNISEIEVKLGSSISFNPSHPEYIKEDVAQEEDLLRRIKKVFPRTELLPVNRAMFMLVNPLGRIITARKPITEIPANTFANS